MAVKVTLKNGEELKQDFVSARTVRDVMKFGVSLESGTVTVLEMMETLVEFVVKLFPDKEGLEDMLWDEYTAEELTDVCQAVLFQVTGGGAQEEPSAEEQVAEKL